jgi:hypothetical protein
MATAWCHPRTTGDGFIAPSLFASRDFRRPLSILNSRLPGRILRDDFERTMTRDDFRRLALAVPGALENAHMAHPDFRVGGRIFATLDYPRPGFAMVKLTLEQREMVMAAEPAAFSPVPGGWGKSGATIMALDHVDEKTAKSALGMAGANVVSVRRSPRR